MCSPPLAGGEHEIITHQHSSERSCTATTKNVYGIRPVTRELQNTVVWLRLWLRSTAVERRGRSLPHRPRTRRRRVFDRLVEQAACRGLLDLTFSIDSTDVRDDARRPRRVEGYDPTAEEYYHGYGCTIVSTGQKIPIAAEFTESKQAPEETAMRVTCDALAVEKPIWMLGDSAYDTLGWHDHLLAAGSCQSLRTTHETPTIRKTSSTGSKPASTNTARTFS